MTKSVALIDDGFQTHKCIYNIAYAYYKLGKLRQSRLFCERLLKLDPLNQQAQDLHQQLDAVVQQSGRRAMDVTRRGPSWFGNHLAAGCGCGYRVI